MEVPLCPFCVFSFQLCMPHQGQNKDSRGQSPGSIVAIYKGPKEGLNVSLGHKGAPLPTFCLPYYNRTP